MKIIKPIIFFILSLITLIIISVIFLFIFVNPNNYKSYITRTLEQQTHSKIAIKGNIKWSIYPEISFKLEDINVVRSVNGVDLDLKTKFLKLNINLFKSIKNIELSFDNIFIDNPTLDIYDKSAIHGKEYYNDNLIIKKNAKIRLANNIINQKVLEADNVSETKVIKDSKNKADKAKININKIVISNAVINYFKDKRSYNLATFDTDILIDTNTFANVMIINIKPKKLEVLSKPANLELNLKLTDNHVGDKNIIIQSVDIAFNASDMDFLNLSSLFGSKYITGLFSVNLNLTTTFQKLVLSNIIRGLNGKFNFNLLKTNLEKLEKLDYLANILNLIETYFQKNDLLSAKKPNQAKEVLDLLSQNRLFKQKLKIKTIDNKNTTTNIKQDDIESTDIKTQGVVKQGIIQNTVGLLNNFYTLDGQGRFDLNSNLIKYNIIAFKTENKDKPDRIVIPIVLYGNITKPEVRLDIRKTIDNNKLFERALKLLSGD
tara:strand:+ start:5281 stop:6747 length:1467 start_codon:yes stop_codon:yes gene_type:complete